MSRRGRATPGRTWQRRRLSGRVRRSRERSAARGCAGGKHAHRGLDQDEARVGQQGSLTYVWAEKGSRPAAFRDLGTEWATLFGAVCAERGVGAALVLPDVNIHAMNLHLAEISRSVASGAHGLVVLDGAGWHRTGKRLRIPHNISLLHLPPYSPELNPVENVWAYLRHNQLSNRVFDSYDAIVDTCCTAWNALVAAPDRIRSIATRTWTKTVNA